MNIEYKNGLANPLATIYFPTNWEVARVADWIHFHLYADLCVYRWKGGWVL